MTGSKTTIRRIWSHAPPWIKSFYFVTGFSFFLWMLLFDAEDLLTLYQLRRKLHKLHRERIYYMEQIKQIKKNKQELTSNTDLLEKFAREKYFMRKKTEDLYIVRD